MPLEAIAAVLGGVAPALLLVVLAIADARVGVVLDELRAWPTPASEPTRVTSR